VENRQRDDSSPIRKHEIAGADEQRPDPTLDKRLECCPDVAVTARIENDELLPELMRRRLYILSF
jgi:hypothetical protein